MRVLRGVPVHVHQKLHVWLCVCGLCVCAFACVFSYFRTFYLVCADERREESGAILWVDAQHSRRRYLRPAAGFFARRGPHEEGAAEAA